MLVIATLTHKYGNHEGTSALQMHVKPPPHWIQDVVKISKDGVFCTYSELFVAAGATTGAVMVDMKYLQAYRTDLYDKLVKNDQIKRRGGISRIYFDGKLETTEIDKMVQVFHLLQNLPMMYKENAEFCMAVSILTDHLKTVNIDRVMDLKKKRNLSDLHGNIHYQKTSKVPKSHFAHVSDREDLESMVLPYLHQSGTANHPQNQPNREHEHLARALGCEKNNPEITQQFTQDNFNTQILEDSEPMILPYLHRRNTSNQPQNELNEECEHLAQTLGCEMSETTQQLIQDRFNTPIIENSETMVLPYLHQSNSANQPQNEPNKDYEHLAQTLGCEMYDSETTQPAQSSPCELTLEDMHNILFD